ncbi:MAG: methylenetetrahydrofolate reductase C-terminal domain-containing protein [Anaerolineae bacterium]|nr:methylenetetrahydrofolate reductase C-terminal domain-containing protein [Anaerolineae bacterium]MDW8099395.1 methylenetetrahydrofolate reductase C-terminal domain-containing protein [Anaerolineae bacterium]
MVLGIASRHSRAVFRPLVPQSPLARWVAGVERWVKGALFGCRMCGHCLLLETGFICPMSCPDGLRNGPCLDSPPEHCFSGPAEGCAWARIYRRAEQRGDLDRLLEVVAPLDSRRVGCETILTAYRIWRSRAQGPRLRDLIADRARFHAEWEAFRYELRQPSWWRGDGRYHPPAYTEPASPLEDALRSRRFVVIAGAAAPPEARLDRIAQVAKCLRGNVHAVGFLSRPPEVPCMSALACAISSLQLGLEPLLHLQVYHRDRYAIEAEAIGAATVGVRNILCLFNKSEWAGSGPTPRPGLNDLDPVQALWMLRRLRDEGVNIDGEPVGCRPKYFLGAVVSPYALAPRYEALAVEKKINAGAQFLLTLPVFDLSRFTAWLDALDRRNLLGKTYLIVTVMVLRDAQQARFLSKELPGCAIPDIMLAHMEDALDPREEGIQIALDLISRLRRIGKVQGLHLLAPYQEEAIPRLVQESGLDLHIGSTKAFSNNGCGLFHRGHLDSINVLPFEGIS